MRIDEPNGLECREILSRVSKACLRCSLDNRPDVFPVRIAYEEKRHQRLYPTLGQKIRWRRSHPKFCVQVDEIGSQSDWASVIANGEYQELPEPWFEPEPAHAPRLLEKRRHWVV